MKTKSLRNLALSLSLSMTTIMSTAVLAKNVGGDSGGGGDTLVDNKTGEIISIADPLAKKEIHYKRARLTADTKTAMSELITMTSRYFLNSELLKSITDEDSVDYRLVDELPALTKCDERLKYSTNDEVSISKSACTVGRVTYLKKSDYEKLLAKDSKRELASLLFHEGLRRIVNLSNDDLVALTNGVRTALDVFAEQKIDQDRQLTEEERTKLLDFLDAVYLNGLHMVDYQNMSLKTSKSLLARIVLNDFGGVSFKTSKLGANVRLGVGANVGSFYSLLRTGNGGSVGSNSIIMGSFFFNCDLGENVQVINSTFSCDDKSEIGDDVVIKNSSLITLGVAYFEKESDLRSRSTFIGQGTKIIGSTLSGDTKIGANVQLLNVKASIGHTRIENNVILANVKDASVLSEGQGMIGSLLGGFRSGKIIFKSGTSIDLENEIVCASGKNFFAPYDGAHFEVKSKADLLKICKKK